MRFFLPLLPYTPSRIQRRVNHLDQIHYTLRQVHSLDHSRYIENDRLQLDRNPA
jgi:hypothetical protein